MCVCVGFFGGVGCRVLLLAGRPPPRLSRARALLLLAVGRKRGLYRNAQGADGGVP